MGSFGTFLRAVVRAISAIVSRLVVQNQGLRPDHPQHDDCSFGAGCQYALLLQGRFAQKAPHPMSSTSATIYLHKSFWILAMRNSTAWLEQRWKEVSRTERRVRDVYDRFLREQPPRFSSNTRSRRMSLSWANGRKRDSQAAGQSQSIRTRSRTDVGRSMVSPNQGNESRCVGGACL
jgi:hypothetical protein